MIIKRLEKKKTKKENESLTDSFINSGGQTTQESIKNLEQLDSRFTLRIPSMMLQQIDKQRKKKVGKFSRNNWILEAIEEKLMSK
jgi:predicted DNA binding CopG/RHH family protein